MAREPRSAREDPLSVESGGWRTHRGHVKLHGLGRVFVCVIVFMLICGVYLVDQNPARKDFPMRLVEGMHGVETISLAVSPKGSLIATTDTAGRVSLRDETNGWWTETFADCSGQATSVAFAPDGRFLAIAGAEFGVALWDRERAGRERFEFLPVQGARTIAFSSCGRYLAVATDADHHIGIWDWAERRETVVLNCHFPAIALAFSPDGRYLAAGTSGDQEPTSVWDVETGRARHVLAGSRGTTASVAFSPDGTLLATAGHFDTRLIRLWDMHSGQLRRTLVGHSYGTNSVAFSPGGKSLASAGCDGMVRLWNLATGQQYATLDGRTHRLNHVAFSPDGRILFATGSADNDVRVWDLTETTPHQGQTGTPVPLGPGQPTRILLTDITK
jgi:WD40 repeat protein